MQNPEPVADIPWMTVDAYHRLKIMNWISKWKSKLCDYQQTQSNRTYPQSSSVHHQYQIPFKDLSKLIICYWIDFQFHQRYYITLHRTFDFINTNLHNVLNKKRYLHKTSYSTYLNVDHWVWWSQKMLTYDLGLSHGKTLIQTVSITVTGFQLIIKSWKSEWKPIYHNQGI